MAQEISAEVIELAEHIIEVRKTRAAKHVIEQPTSAMVGDKEIPYGTSVWTINPYATLDKPLVERAGYIVAVDPKDRTRIEYAQKPYPPRKFPTCEQESSQKRPTASLSNGYPNVYVSCEEAIEALIVSAQRSHRYNLEIFTKTQANLDRAIELRNKKDWPK